MKTAVRDTSIEAYQKTEKSRAIQRDRVLQQVKISGSSGICIADLSWILEIRTSSVSARLKELKDARVIEFVSKRPSLTTKIMAEHWRVKNTGMLF